MKKILLLSILSLVFNFCVAQTVQNTTDTKFSKQVNIGKGGTGYIKTDTSAWLEIGLDNTNKALRISRGDTATLPMPKYGLIHYQISNGKLYWRDATKWNECGVPSGVYVKYNDSLSVYVTPNQLNDSLEHYVKYTDTASMLSNYINSTGYGITRTGQFIEVDTTTPATGLATQFDIKQKWDILGNAGTDSIINFLGTTDQQAFSIRTNNVQRAKWSKEGIYTTNGATATDASHIFQNLSSNPQRIADFRTSTGTPAFRISPNYFSADAWQYDGIGQSMGIYAQNASLGTINLNINASNTFGGTGDKTQVRIGLSTSVSPTSGTGRLRTLLIASTVNQTGTASGKVIGVDISENIVSAATSDYTALRINPISTAQTTANCKAIDVRTFGDASSVFKVDYSLNTTFGTSITMPIVSTITSLTVVKGMYTISCNNGAGAITVTLPNATGNTGMILIVKRNAASTGDVTIASGGTSQIQGYAGSFAATQTLTALGTAFQKGTFQSDGTDWHLIAN